MLVCLLLFYDFIVSCCNFGFFSCYDCLLLEGLLVIELLCWRVCFVLFGNLTWFVVVLLCLYCFVVMLLTFWITLLFDMILFSCVGLMLCCLYVSVVMLFCCDLGFGVGLGVCVWHLLFVFALLFWFRSFRFCVVCYLLRLVLLFICAFSLLCWFWYLFDVCKCIDCCLFDACLAFLGWIGLRWLRFVWLLIVVCFRLLCFVIVLPFLCFALFVICFIVWLFCWVYIGFVFVIFGLACLLVLVDWFAYCLLLCDCCLWMLLNIVGVFDLCLFTVMRGRLWLLLCYGIIVFGFALLRVCLFDCVWFLFSCAWDFVYLILLFICLSCCIRLCVDVDVVDW